MSEVGHTGLTNTVPPHLLANPSGVGTFAWPPVGTSSWPLTSAVTDKERDYLTRLGEPAPTRKLSLGLAQAIAVMVRERPGEDHLLAWLAQATASGIQELTHVLG
jgi:hypothetical protein